MMAGFIYIGVFLGCIEGGWGFWRSFMWPMELGRMIASSRAGRSEP